MKKLIEFKRRLEDALKAKTSWGRNEIKDLTQKIIDEMMLENE